MNVLSTEFFPCQISKNDLGRLPFSLSLSSSLLRHLPTTSNTGMDKTASTWGILLHLIYCQLMPTSYCWFGHWGGDREKNIIVFLPPFLVSISLMFDMGYTQSILIHLVKQQGAEEAGIILLFICYSLLLSGSLHCFGLLHFPLLWHVLPTGLSLSQHGSPMATVLQQCLCLNLGPPWAEVPQERSCPDVGHPRTTSLRCP